MDINELEVYGVIYKITNNINGKSYIGQTVRSVEVRIKEHIRKSCIMSRAFKKYGIENFTIEIIDSAYSEEELNKKEIYWISKFDTFKNGYNLCEGGGQTSGYHHTEEAKKKMSNTRILKGDQIGENNNFYGKHHSEEQRKKWSKQRRGRKLTDEWKQKISDNSSIKKKVINIDTKEVFNSVREAAEFYGLKDTHISRVCKGKRKRTGGFRWMHYEEYIKLNTNNEAS